MNNIRRILNVPKILMLSHRLSHINDNACVCNSLPSLSQLRRRYFASMAGSPLSVCKSGGLTPARAEMACGGSSLRPCDATYLGVHHMLPTQIRYMIQNYTKKSNEQVVCSLVDVGVAINKWCVGKSLAWNQLGKQVSELPQVREQYSDVQSRDALQNEIVEHGHCRDGATKGPHLFEKVFASPLWRCWRIMMVRWLETSNLLKPYQVVHSWY